MMNNLTKFKETELGLIPENWEVLNMGDCLDLVIDYRGKTPKKLGAIWSDSGYRALSAKNIANGEIKNPESINYVDEALYKKWMKAEVKRGDTLLTSEAPLGEFCYWNSDEKIVLSQRLFCLRPKQGNVDSAYFYQFIKSPFYQNELKGRGTGSTVTGIRQSELVKTKVILPPVAEQRKIAEVLGALDEKIELNRKMHKTMEFLAQAIFKKWFINDADPCWETKKLGELLTIDRGLSYKGKYLVSEGVPMFNLGSFNLDGNLKLDTLKYYSGNFKTSCTVKSGDIIIANTDMTQNRVILGSACIIPDLFKDQNILFTHHLYALRPMNEINNLFIYQILKTREFKDQAIGFATGTTVLFLPKEAILNYEIKYPCTDRLKEYNNNYQNILNEQLILTQEIETLSQIRDSLLPRLMSGKLRVR